jgi:hypothetical protein
MASVQVTLRWPSSYELDANEILLDKSTTIQTRIEIISTYVEKNWDRFRLSELSDRNGLAKSSKVANDWKEGGNEHYKNKRWKEAEEAYTQVCTHGLH